MTKKRLFRSFIAAACLLALLFLVGCGAKQSTDSAAGHGDRQVGCGN